MIKIFIIDDDPQILLTIEQNLDSNIYLSYTFTNARDALEKFSEIPPDIILLDLIMPDVDGFSFLKSLKNIDANIPVIIVSGEKKINSAVKAMKLGAVDFITKPFNFEELKNTINEYVNIKRLSDPNTSTIVGNSPEILKVLEDIKKVSNSYDTTILINGETGTGKELVAKQIHQLSKRRNHAFFEVNCSAIQETLLESELFGYEKGAFTGALSAKKGLLEVADKGTFFLDEIGDMSSALQAKLLKVLEQKKIRRTGGLKEIDIDVRFICATSKNLKILMQQEKFRPDLYYRISVATIKLPSLRQRKKDILMLSDYFLKQFSKKFNKTIKGFSLDTQKKLVDHKWPGNVRELKNAIERAVLFEDDDMIINIPLSSDDFILGPTHPIKAGGITLDQLEKEFIINTLKETRGHQLKAAEKLKISRAKLIHRIKKYNIDIKTLKNVEI